MRFPVINTAESIPWGVIAPHEEQALKNHCQSLKRLAERGGLSWVEMWSVLDDTPFKIGASEALARVKVLEIVERFNSQN